MNIVHVNNIDLPGRRFNGHDLQIELNESGINAKQLVYDKVGDNPNTISFARPFDKNVNRYVYSEFENNLAMQSLAYPFGWDIMLNSGFQQADIVHYHLIHNLGISLFTFEDLVKAKPSVWTLHDPWAFTGHCIHPYDCEKWKTGCIQCPKLDLLFKMKYDKAFQMWKIKRDIYSKLDIDIVVASDFMMKFVKESPLTKHFEKVHFIPFGIDLDLFKDVGETERNKKELGIPLDNFVIAFRAMNVGFKGFEYISEMLEILEPSIPVTILTVNDTGILDAYRDRYNVIELGWVNDDKKMAQIYSATDLFLMPSTAESFGMMAIEAMASSRPIVVFEGTALPNVTFAPECGVAVKMGDSIGLKEVIERLISNPDECKYRGRLGRQLAEENYDHKVYFKRIVKLYDDLFMEKCR